MYEPIFMEDIIEEVFQQLKHSTASIREVDVQYQNKICKRKRIAYKKNNLTFSKFCKEDGTIYYSLFTNKEPLLNIIVKPNEPSDNLLEKLYCRIEMYQKEYNLLKDQLEKMNIYDKIKEATKENKEYDDEDQEGLGY